MNRAAVTPSTMRWSQAAVRCIRRPMRTAPSRTTGAGRAEATASVIDDGGLMIGAFFMATDYVTSPLTTRGKIIFSVGAGVLVVLIRVLGNMPEGVAYSILVMNAFTPLIDRYVRPKPYGYVKKKERG